MEYFNFRARKSLSFEEPTVEDAASRNRRLEEAAKTASKVTFSEPSKPESKLNSYDDGVQVIRLCYHSSQIHDKPFS